MASSEKNLELNCDDFKCIEDPVIGELGGGAQSVVRLTFHTTLGPVAVKCFSVTGGPPDRRRLEKKIVRELQIVQKAANQFIVQTHGWVKWPKAMGLVMEYLPVGSIRQFIVDSFDELTPKVILRMAHEIACAVAYMHNLPGDHRVVHGDLKPENVLLTKDLHCKVVDFGSAELSAFTGAATLTGPKREKPSMTLAYAAPEKLKKPNIKPKKEQDTYSFGMLLYVLLTGSTPYTQTYQESRFLDSIIRGERPDTEEIDELKEDASTDDKQIIEVLESIMQKCWQQDPSDRPNMIAVRDQLQELRDQQNNADTLAEVVELLRVMSLSPPVAKEQKLVPLHQFSPINGEFAREGIVYNIYNLPNVQQAAITCNVVEFEQAASGIAAPGELPEKNSTMDQASKVQDASSASEPTDPCTYSAEQGDYSEMRESNAPKEPDLNHDVTTSTSETVGSSTSSDSPVKPKQQPASQQRPEPSLRISHREMEKSSSSKVSEFNDDDDAISIFETTGSSTSSAPPVVPSDNVQRSDKNATDASSTSNVSSIRSRISLFEIAAPVKSMQKPSSQQRPVPSLRSSHSEMKESSSSKVSEFDDDDDAIPTFELTGSSTISAPPGNIPSTRSTEKKPTLDEVFEALVDDTGNSRRRNENVKESSSTSNASSIRSFYKNVSPMKQILKKAKISASSGNVAIGNSAGNKLSSDEAFESQGQTWLPSNVRPAPDFLDEYKVLLKNQKYEDAKTMTTTITSMIEANIDATAKDVREFGRKLRGKKLFLESIAIFDAAFAMFEKMEKTEKNLQWMMICVGEMMYTNEAMIGDDASMKLIDKSYVIPLMREKLRHIEDTSLVNEQFKFLQVCHVLHYIEYSEGLVDELEEREQTVRFALARMEDVFKAEVTKFQVYGNFLNNLGVVCNRTSRFEEAASFFKLAIDARKATIDFDDEELKKQWIEKSENNLKNVQRKIK